MPRKVVKVYLSKQLKKMLELLSQKIGISESETMRIALYELSSEHREINLN